VEKFCEVTLPSPYVITANTLHIRPMFGCSFKKIVGAPVPGEVCASKLWSSSSALKKHDRGQNMVFRKSWFEWVKMHKLHIQNFVVSGPKFTELFSRKAGGIDVDNLVFRFLISSSVPETFAIEVWSCPKSPLILHVFGLQFFSGGEPPNNWDLTYKIELTSDHVAKFRGDRPTGLRELGDLAVKKKE